MLQQTRVETVLPYYHRFLERFPTVEDLAAASVDEVLAQWSGLGYYRRARQLHQAAGQIVARGGLPETVDGLRELSGIGPYTAAAVASIAFGAPAGVMDGNVERVVSRLLATSENPKSAAGRRRLLRHVEEQLLDPDRPGDGNQALMELGATVCTPRRPKCLLCPLREGCRAAAEGDPEQYPVPRKRPKPVRVRRAVAVVRISRDGVLLYRRPEDSELLAGTWELPWVDAAEPEEFSGGAEEIAHGLAERYGGRFELEGRVGEVRHGITHRSFTVEVWRARRIETGEGGTAGALKTGHFDTTARRGLATSSLVDKALALLEGET